MLFVQFVLTAAHCVVNASSLEGENNSIDKDLLTVSCWSINDLRFTLN